MAFRFRKSIKVLPGVRVNVGKRGASVSLGTRGMRVTVGPRGTTTSVGIPGTGLSYRSRSSQARGGSAGGGSSGSGSAGLVLGLVGLGFFASCLVCVSSGGGGSSAKRSTEASMSAPASKPEEPREGREPSMAASAPAVVHAFGDGAACRSLGSCRALETSSDTSGTTWHLASASNVSDARIELRVHLDGTQIAAVGITGDPSGDLAALVLRDLAVREDDRSALTWHVREHLRAGSIEEAKPLCAAGICAVAGLESGAPATRFRLDPTIASDQRAMKRAAKAAVRAAKLEASRRVEERPPAGRSRPRPDGVEPRQRAEQESVSRSLPRRTCCKHCSTGIPCGDTCIAANRTCRKGPGCAC